MSVAVTRTVAVVLVLVAVVAGCRSLTGKSAGTNVEAGRRQGVQLDARGR